MDGPPLPSLTPPQMVWYREGGVCVHTPVIPHSDDWFHGTRRLHSTFREIREEAWKEA